MPSVRGRALISLTLTGPWQNTPGNCAQLNRKNGRFLIIPGLICAQSPSKSICAKTAYATKMFSFKYKLKSKGDIACFGTIIRIAKSMSQNSNSTFFLGGLILVKAWFCISNMSQKSLFCSSPFQILA